MFMYFYGDPDPDWWPHREALGVQAAVDDLKRKGLPSDWPTQVVDLNDPATIKAEATKGSYKSQCPHYGGYWLCGGTGSVECRAYDGLLPGIIWYKTCEKRHEECPYFKMKENPANV